MKIDFPPSDACLVIMLLAVHTLFSSTSSKSLRPFYCHCCESTSRPPPTRVKFLVHVLRIDHTRRALNNNCKPSRDVKVTRFPTDFPGRSYASHRHEKKDSSRKPCAQIEACAQFTVIVLRINLRPHPRVSFCTAGGKTLTIREGGASLE